MKIVQSKNCIKRIPVEQCHLYGIRSIHALAKRLGWNLDKLESLAADGGYRVYPLNPSGRMVQEPSAVLQKLHRSIHKYLSRVDVPTYLHSAVKGHSYLTNAKVHTNCDSLIKIDIKKFFPSVPQRLVKNFFYDTLNCEVDVAGLLANLLLCLQGHVR